MTVSNSFVRLEADNFALTSSVFHDLARNICLCILRLHSYSRNSTLDSKQRMLIISAEFSSKQSHEIWPWTWVECSKDHLAKTHYTTRNIHQKLSMECLMFMKSLWFLPFILYKRRCPLGPIYHPLKALWVQLNEAFHRHTVDVEVISKMGFCVFPITVGTRYSLGKG